MRRFWFLSTDITQGLVHSEVKYSSPIFCLVFCQSNAAYGLQWQKKIPWNGTFLWTKELFSSFLLFFSSFPSSMDSWTVACLHHRSRGQPSPTSRHPFNSCGGIIRVRFFFYFFFSSSTAHCWLINHNLRRMSNHVTTNYKCTNHVLHHHSSHGANIGQKRLILECSPFSIRSRSKFHSKSHF